MGSIDQLPTALGWFNIVISLLMLLLGWLLNRVFQELDRLRKSDDDLALSVNRLTVELPTQYITKADFIRHEVEEREWIREFREEVRSNLERIHSRLDALNHKGVQRE